MSDIKTFLQTFGLGPLGAIRPKSSSNSHLHFIARPGTQKTKDQQRREQKDKGYQRVFEWPKRTLRDKIPDSVFSVHNRENISKLKEVKMKIKRLTKQDIFEQQQKLKFNLSKTPVVLIEKLKWDDLARHYPKMRISLRVHKMTDDEIEDAEKPTQEENM